MESLSQEAMNRYGAIFQFNLPDREPFTVLYAQPPSSSSVSDHPFQQQIKLSLPTSDERVATLSDCKYLWIGVLPEGASEYNTAASVSKVKKEKTAEEKARKQEFDKDVWFAMDRGRQAEFTQDDYQIALKQNAIDTRCVLEDDRYALRVVVKVPEPGQKAAEADRGGGLKFYVLGRDVEDDDEADLCEARVVPKDIVFYFPEFQGESTATSERQRTLAWGEAIKKKLNSLANETSGSKRRTWEDEEWPEADVQLANQIESLLSAFAETQNDTYVSQLQAVLQDTKLGLYVPDGTTRGYIDKFVTQTKSFGNHIDGFVQEVNTKYPDLGTGSDIVKAIWSGIQHVPFGEIVFHHHEVYGILRLARMSNMPDDSAEQNARTLKWIIEVVRESYPPSTYGKATGSQAGSDNIPPMEMLLDAVHGTLGDLVDYNKRAMADLLQHFGPEDTAYSLDDCIQRYCMAPDTDSAKTWMRAIGRFIIRGMLARDAGIAAQVGKLHSMLEEVKTAKARRNPQK